MILSETTELTRMAVAQALGETYMEEHGYLEAIPADKLVEVGKDILDGEFTAEKFTKALSVLLAYREVISDDFKPLYDDIMVKRVDWGGFVERAYVDFADVMDDPMLSLEDGTSYADIEHTFYRPKVHSKVYEEGKGIMIPISIQRALLSEAFRGYGEMDSYISKIKAKTRDTLKMALDRYCAIMTMAGIAISTKGTETAVYLLTEALAEKVPGITANTTPAEALANEAYQAFVARKMTEIRMNMMVPSTVYNDGSIAVQSYDNKLYLLSHFARALKFGLYANTRNPGDVRIDFKEIPMWQAVKAQASASGFEYANTSTISFSADPNNKLGLGTQAVEIENVIGFLWDRRALGITVFKEYTTNSYTACADFWNEFIHSLTNQMVDSAFPMVAFINDFAPVGA